MEHLIKETCSCDYCKMIDIMFGDPLFNEWENEFLNSICRVGWYYNYSEKQKRTIVKLFNQQRRKYKV